MTHISSISAGIFSDLSIHVPSTQLTTTDWDGLDATELKALFATEVAYNGTAAAAKFVRVENVREFPSMGTPPNIVNVPVYGSATSQQIQGQSDAPTLELTLNYIPLHWAEGTLLGNMVGDGIQRVYRFALLGSDPTSFASATGGLGTVQNSQFFWFGKMEALQFSPQLTDANTATLTLSIQSEFKGAYTSAPA